MQSLLQYRRFGLAVQKQLRRDQEKTTTMAESPCQSILPTPEPPIVAQCPRTSFAEAVSETDSVISTRTRYSARTALGHALTGIYARDRTSSEGKGSKVFIVNWEGESDPLNPRNWSKSSRIGTTLIISTIAFVVGAASSIDTAILPQASAEFGVSDVVESLATGTHQLYC